MGEPRFSGREFYRPSERPDKLSRPRAASPRHRRGSSPGPRGRGGPRRRRSTARIGRAMIKNGSDGAVRLSQASAMPAMIRAIAGAQRPGAQLQGAAHLAARVRRGRRGNQESACGHDRVAVGQRTDERQRAAQAQEGRQGDPSIELPERSLLLARLGVEQRRSRQARLRGDEVPGGALPRPRSIRPSSPASPRPGPRPGPPRPRPPRRSAPSRLPRARGPAPSPASRPGPRGIARTGRAPPARGRSGRAPARAPAPGPMHPCGRPPSPSPRKQPRPSAVVTPGIRRAARQS